MNLAPLTRPTAPWLHLWAAPTDEVSDALIAWERAALGKRVARLLRGRKCASVAGFFDEAAAALQFPDHFGENWDAFADCFHDLRRFGDKTPVVVCITDAEKLLGTAPAAAAKTLAELLNDVLSEVNTPAKPGKPRPLHVIFHCLSGRAETTAKRWKAAGIELDAAKA